MDSQTLIFEKEGGIAKITPKRPETMNGLDKNMLLELETAYTAMTFDTGDTTEGMWVRVDEWARKKRGK